MRNGERQVFRFEKLLVWQLARKLALESSTHQIPQYLTLDTRPQTITGGA